MRVNGCYPLGDYLTVLDPFTFPVVLRGVKPGGVVCSLVQSRHLCNAYYATRPVKSVIRGQLQGYIT